MAKESPRYIMRNAALFVNRENYLGQASEISFFTLERRMEEVFNAGMEVPIEVEMGYEIPEHSFKMSGWDPTVMKLFGLAIGAETEIMATAATVDDDGTTHSQVAYLRCKIKGVSPDAYSRGDLAEVEYELAFRYFKFEVDGEPIYEMDPFGVSIGGVSQTANIRRALLV